MQKQDNGNAVRRPVADGLDGFISGREVNILQTDAARR